MKIDVNFKIKNHKWCSNKQKNETIRYKIFFKHVSGNCELYKMWSLNLSSLHLKNWRFYFYPFGIFLPVRCIFYPFTVFLPVWCITTSLVYFYHFGVFLPVWCVTTSLVYFYQFGVILPVWYNFTNLVYFLPV